MNTVDTASLPTFNIRNPQHVIAYGFGAGLSPWAPGTMGTLIAVPIYLVLSLLPTTLYLIVLVAMIAAGVWACGAVCREVGEDDPQHIVWDEIVGFLVAMTAAPAGLVWLVAGFLLFRLLDITKPWPISWAQGRGRGGFGLMFDDLLAGLLTFVILQGLAEMVEASLRGASHVAH
jgi:phosphatidylglycerophosphatase A